jgi:cytidine deaminase
MDELELLRLAALARENACAPYSGFKVGGAILTKSGRVFTGINVESASYGLTCCAERVALFKALSEGEREFEAIAVVAQMPGGPMPCGACRQLLIEYAPQAILVVADANALEKYRKFTVSELLPFAFKDFRILAGSCSKDLS